MAIIITIVITFAVYYFSDKKKGEGTTDNSKTVQDYVSAATPGEQGEAKTVVNSFKDNFNESFSENICEQIMNWSDNQLAWAAAYYKEQTGRSFLQDVKDLPYLGWASVSLDDNKLIARLEKLGIN